MPFRRIRCPTGITSSRADLPPVSFAEATRFIFWPNFNSLLDNHGWEWRCYMRDPDGYLIEVGQYTQMALDRFKNYAS